MTNFFIMVKTITVTLLFLFASAGNLLQAQNNPKADSLQFEINKESDIVFKSLLTLEYSWEIKHTNLEKAFEMSNWALSKLTAHHHAEGIAIAHSYIGMYYFIQNNLKEAIRHLKKSEKLFLPQKNYERLSRVYNNLGIVSSNLYDYDAALLYYNKSLEIKEHHLKNTDLSANLINIGTIYYDQGNYEECIRFNEEALIITLREKRITSTAAAYSNLGVAHERLGHYKKSINYALKALELYQNEINNPLSQSRAYSNLGAVYMSQGDYEEAEFYFFRALEINEEINNPTQNLVSLNNLAELYRRQKNLDKAEITIQKTLVLSNKTSDIQEELISLETASNIANDQHDYESALTYFKEYIRLSDSVYTLSNIQNMQLALTQSELAIEKVKEEKELEAKRITAQKLNIRFYFGVITALIVFSMLLIYSLEIRIPNWSFSILNFFFSLSWIANVFLYLFVESGFLESFGTQVFFLIILSVIVFGSMLHAFLQIIFSKKLGYYE